MAWYFPVLLRILVANGLCALVLKTIVGKHSRTTRFFFQFLFCVVLSLAVAGTTGTLTLNPVVVAVLGIGFINGFAAYCQWRATDISLSKNSIFTFWDDIIAMTLSYFILQEGRFFNAEIVAGILVSIGAVMLFVAHQYRKLLLTKTENTTGLSFYGWIMGYSVIWGFAIFAMRYLNVKEHLPVTTFLWAWYGGAFLAATSLLLFHKDKSTSQQEQSLLGWKDYGSVGALSIIIWVALLCAYTAYGLAPQTVVQPIFLVAEMVVPSLIGLYVFREIKEFDWQEKLYFGLGIAGGLLIALNYAG